MILLRGGLGAAEEGASEYYLLVDLLRRGSRTGSQKNIRLICFWTNFVGRGEGGEKNTDKYVGKKIH